MPKHPGTGDDGTVVSRPKKDVKKSTRTEVKTPPLYEMT